MKNGIDCVGVTVSYLCHDGKGNYLMNKRSVNCRDEHGTWDFGGGGLDFGDTVEKTLNKEIEEEYCVTPISYEFMGYFDIFRKQNDTPTHWLSLVFCVLIDREKVKNGEPHKFEELKWVTLDNVPSPLHSAWQIVLPKIIDKLPK
jgi:ADP-ribose pyrophosphatase YjhB (NUDIX family)